MNGERAKKWENKKNMLLPSREKTTSSINVHRLYTFMIDPYSPQIVITPNEE